MVSEKGSEVMEEQRERLERYLDDAFLSVADRYAPLNDNPYQVQLKKELDNIANSKFLVPVLGIQGTGKSSLLNALLMDDLILPVDADETTAIPVEIHYSQEKDGAMEVYFSYKRDVIATTDPAELEQYVHNRYNAGNEKNVSHIIIYKDNELLKNNLVLVDLPGVGSLTPANVEVTMNYINRLSAAIFLLRTVPPITRPEQIFLRNVWPQLSKAWFVQNQWNDESLAEVEDGREYNRYVLEQIADQHHTEKDIDIKIINVYQALNAKLQQDSEADEASGMKDFRTFLQNISENWKALLEEQFHVSIVKLASKVKATIETKQAELNMTTDELQAKYEVEERQYEDVYKRNKRRIRDLESTISNYKMDLMDFASSESRAQMENLRNEMRRIIGSGVVDGALLNKAYQDNEAICAEDAMEKLSFHIIDIQREMKDAVEELEIKDEKGDFTKQGSFERKKGFKGEKSLPYIANIGGGIGGAIATAKVGGMVGTAIGGPVGTAVGAVAGLVVGFGVYAVSNWLGKKAKEGVGKIRQSYSLKDLESPLNQFRTNLQQTIEDILDEAFDDMESALQKFKRAQLDEVEAEKRKNLASIKEHGQNIEAKKAQLTKDYQKVVRFEEELHGRLS